MKKKCLFANLSNIWIKNVSFNLVYYIIIVVLSFPTLTTL